MQKHITDSTATYPGGISPGHRLMKVSSGLYSGRVAMLLQSASSEIKITYSDYPYNSWSTPATVISDSGDNSFDAVMDGNGNIYVAYSFNSNNDLVMRKLSFTNGSWSVGSLVTIYDADDNYYPSLCLESNDRLWVGWSRLNGGSYYINAKYSDDWGVNWAGGVSSPGDTLSSGATESYVKMLNMADYIYAIYSNGGTKIYYRRKQYYAALWDSEAEIFFGTGLDENFDAAVSNDNKIGLIWDDGEIKYKEFDGNNWSGVYVVDSDGGTFPQIKYSNNVAYLVYISASGSGQNNLLYSCRNSTGFSTPAILDRSKSIFNRVLCYDLSTASFEDLTTAAGNDSASDIYHSDSSAMFKDTGDTIYFGLDKKFHYLKILLGTAGVGGTVGWLYFDGNEWVSFVPSGGSWHFTDADKGLLLWDDIYSVPENWQKNSVNGIELFWIKATVSTTFTTGPCGTQITSIPDIKAIVLMER